MLVFMFSLLGLVPHHTVLSRMAPHSIPRRFLHLSGFRSDASNQTFKIAVA